MKNLFRTAAIVSFLAIAVSCGAALDNSASNTEDLAARSFDPMGAYAAAKKAAGSFTTGITAISLTATQKAKASSKSGVSSFTWVWTVVGSDGMFVDVEVSQAGAKVINHESRMILAYQSTFEPKNVSVNASDVLNIAAQQKSGQPTDLYLGARLLDSGASQLTWSVGFASGEVLVDGDTGDVAKSVL